jgi:Domain of unknown function (DUF1707)/Domain of unknown function (DUF4190)
MMSLTPGYGFPPADYGRMLASTADRERALDVLRAGFAEGRLTQEEHDERVGRVYTARTYADLAAVTGDLPGGQPPVPLYPPAAAHYPPVAAQYPPALPQYPPAVPQYRPAVPRHPPVLPHYPLTIPPAYPPVQESKINALASASLWCGIAGVIFGLPSIAAVVLSSVAFRQIRRTGEAGAGSATAGLVLGLLGIVLFVARVVIGFHDGSY